jgi:uncharacterized protein (DUF1330 family)
VSAYVILIRNNIVNQSELDTYAAMARKARGAEPPTPLAYYGEAAALEGPHVDGVVILEFKSMDAAKAWYDSPAYQAAKAHRLLGADCRVILTDGVPGAGEAIRGTESLK